MFLQKQYGDIRSRFDLIKNKKNGDKKFVDDNDCSGLNNKNLYSDFNKTLDEVLNLKIEMASKKEELSDARGDQIAELTQTISKIAGGTKDQAKQTIDPAPEVSQ
jgi:hypothetical protein